MDKNVNEMRHRIIRYLRKNNITDVSETNRLFVSLFLSINDLHPTSEYIKGYVISKNQEEYFILSELIKICNTCNSSLSLEELMSLFEFVISPGDRKVNGSIYTPKEIRARILCYCLDDYDNNKLLRLRIADLSCGCGGFLVDVAKLIHKRTGICYKYIFENNIYGVDIQEYSVERCRILLSLLALTEGEEMNYDFNLMTSDSLDLISESWDKRYTNFDLVVGNPPYVCVKNMSILTREKIHQYEVCSEGNTDLYIAFFQIAYESLKEGGRMGYITMNSFLKSLNARPLRRFFSKCKPHIRIEDFRGGQVFRGKSTYTCIFYLDKKENGFVEYWNNSKINLSDAPLFQSVQYDELDDNNGWNLNNVNQCPMFESIGIPLKKYCASRHGIATLSNKTYIFSPCGEDDTKWKIIKGDTEFWVEKSICKRIVNSNKLNSNIELMDIIQYVIYPYYSKDGHTLIINEEEMKQSYPFAYQYLCSQRDVLDKRDKGNTSKYPKWYAYGRTQSLSMPRVKLFFPKIANKRLSCILVDDEDMLLYNGMAFVGDSMKRMLVLKKIIESSIFWEYVVMNSKPYNSGYYSLNGSNIMNFGIPHFSATELNTLLLINKQDEIDKWLIAMYNKKGLQTDFGS